MNVQLYIVSNTILCSVEIFLSLMYQVYSTDDDIHSHLPIQKMFILCYLLIQQMMICYLQVTAVVESVGRMRVQFPTQMQLNMNILSSVSSRLDPWLLNCILCSNTLTRDQRRSRCTLSPSSSIRTLIQQILSVSEFTHQHCFSDSNLDVLRYNSGQQDLRSYWWRQHSRWRRNDSGGRRTGWSGSPPSEQVQHHIKHSQARRR